MESDSTGTAARAYRWATCLVLALAVALRLGLAAVNTEANDEHLEVIRPIAFEGRFPGRLDAWEGFQPKLYYALVAVVWRIHPPASGVEQARLAQLVSVVAGSLTLLVVLCFLRRLNLSPRVSFFAFALVALNPKFIGINGQATNDSLAILFAVTASYFAFRFVRDWRAHHLAWSMVFSILAALTKGNTLVIPLVTLVVLAVALIQPQDKRPLSRARLLGYGVGFAVGCLTFVLPFSLYYTHYREYGTPFVINSNMLPNPRPALLTESFVGRPGTTSIVNTYLTFRLINLLQEPYIAPEGNSDKGYPYAPHRTSLWSQLYGRLHFVHFDQWPPTWQNTSPFVTNLGRALLVMGLFPTLLLVVALLRSLALPLHWLRNRRRSWTPPYADLLLMLTAWGYLAFIIQYTLTYRDFSTMKAIFLLPGLLGFLGLFAGELQRLDWWTASRRWASSAVNVALGALLVLYVADVVALIVQLAV